MDKMDVSGLRLVSLNSKEELSDIATEWEKLRSNVSRSTVFQSWEWCSAWWEVFGENFDQLAVLCAYAGDDLVMILPVALKPDYSGQRTFYLMGDDLSDYVDILVKPGYESYLRDVILKAMKTYSVTRFFARYLPSWSPLYQAILDFAESKTVGVFYDSHWIDAQFYQIILPESWDQYLENYLGQRIRRNVRRSFREVESRNITIGHSDAPGPDEISRMVDLHCESFAKRGFSPSPFTEPPKRKFLEMGLSRLFATGQARVFTLMDGPVMVGFDVILKDRSWFYGYLTGLNVDYLDLSPGIILKSVMIQNAIQSGYYGVDFGMGGEAYKLHWCDTHLPIMVATIEYRGALRGYLSYLREKVQLRTRVKRAISSVLKQSDQPGEPG